MMKKRTYILTLQAIAILLALALALAPGATAWGAETAQGAGGKLSGTVTVAGAGASGITVELRQRANDGADSAVASTTTGDGGAYSFANVASAPSDAFYYVRFAGAANTLAAWYTFPIIYVQGSDFSVPTVEFGDVHLLEPVQDAVLALPGTLRWNGRGAGETYRVFVYASGQSDKPAHDSGSLGTATSYTISEGSLPDGRYEAVVQVRDAVAGYGQSQARFRFTVGAAPAQPQQPPVSSDPSTPASGEGSTNSGPPAQPQGDPPASEGAGEGAEGHDGSVDRPSEGGVETSKPDVQLNLSANKTQVEPGDTLIYKIEIENKGDAPAPGVVVTNLLPTGLIVDSAHATTSAGAVAVQGNTVTAQVGDLAPAAKVVVEIPVSIGKEVGSNISTQASAQYNGAPGVVQSNAYIAQVADPQSGPVSPPQSDPQTKPQEKPQEKPAEQPQSKPQEPPKESKPQQPQQPQQPQSKPANNPPKNAPMPNTGGSFPLFLAVVLVTVTLLARYLRAKRPRRT